MSASTDSDLAAAPLLADLSCLLVTIVLRASINSSHCIVWCFLRPCHPCVECRCHHIPGAVQNTSELGINEVVLPPDRANLSNSVIIDVVLPLDPCCDAVKMHGEIPLMRCRTPQSW